MLRVGGAPAQVPKQASKQAREQCCAGREREPPWGCVGEKLVLAPRRHSDRRELSVLSSWARHGHSPKFEMKTKSA